MNTQFFCVRSEQSAPFGRVIPILRSIILENRARIQTLTRTHTLRTHTHPCHTHGPTDVELVSPWSSSQPDGNAKQPRYKAAGIYRTFWSEFMECFLSSLPIRWRCKFVWQFESCYVLSNPYSEPKTFCLLVTHHTTKNENLISAPSCVCCEWSMKLEKVGAVKSLWSSVKLWLYAVWGRGDVARSTSYDFDGHIRSWKICMCVFVCLASP